MAKKELTEEILQTLTNAASLSNVKLLELAGKGFTALPGIKACPRITRLDLSSNALTAAEVRIASAPTICVAARAECDAPKHSPCRTRGCLKHL